MTVIGEVVQRWLVSIVRTARDLVMLGGSAACGPAEAAAGVLALVRFAQNARARSESVAVVGRMTLIAVGLSAHVASAGAMSSVDCRVVCGDAGSAAFVIILAFDEFFDDSSAWRLIWMLLSVGFCCPFGGVIGRA
jgi:hypothetical protein